MSDGGIGLESLERTVVRVGDADVVITLQDAKEMQAALLGYLKASKYEDRGELMRWSQGPSVWLDPDGIVRIGPWVLGVEDREIILRYREPPAGDAAKAHKAYLAKKDGRWIVKEVLTERIRVRR